MICVGGVFRPAFEGAITLDVSGDRAALADLLADLDPEVPARVAFVVPPSSAWPLPIYELALMTQRRAREAGLLKLELVLITPEEAPLIVFGTAASEALSQMLAGRRIEVEGLHPRHRGARRRTDGCTRATSGSRSPASSPCPCWRDPPFPGCPPTSTASSRSTTTPG